MATVAEHERSVADRERRAVLALKNVLALLRACLYLRREQFRDFAHSVADVFDSLTQHFFARVAQQLANSLAAVI